MDIYFSSDWHAFHENICRGVSKWDDKRACRDFETLEEHNETLINNINNTVKKEDIIYMLGDVAFGGKQNLFEFLSRINCKNIHMCLGNHDHHIRKNATVLDTLNGNKEIRVQTLFKSVNDIMNKKIGNERFVMCHYAMRTWENGHHGSIMLYGHSHGSLPEYDTTLPVTVHTSKTNNEVVKVMNQTLKFKTMDVGIDTHPEFRPYHIDEIKEIMSSRIPLRVDHHNENTN
jgi:calcineurin-like phosphoesterase family protein